MLRVRCITTVMTDRRIPRPHACRLAKRALKQKHAFGWGVCRQTRKVIGGNHDGTEKRRS